MKRNYANRFQAPHSILKKAKKPLTEIGVVKSLLEGMEYKKVYIYHDLKISLFEPPDIIAKDKHDNKVGIEVTEFVSQEAIEANIKGNDVYHDWLPNDVITEIERKIQKKGSNNFKDTTCVKKILLIHTDEIVVCSDTLCNQAIENHQFKSSMIFDEVYFLFWYDPAIQTYPYIKLKFQ